MISDEADQAMISDEHKQAILNRYRRGLARGDRRLRQPAPIDVPRLRKDAFIVVRQPLGNSCYRLGHLPTADEQIENGEDR